MINKRFTFRENFFLILLFMLLAAVLSYLFVGESLYAKLRTVRTELAKAEDELEIQRYMAERKARMKSQMEEEPGRNRPVPGSYSNLTWEIEELSRILEGARTYELSFSQEDRWEDVVRRDIFISYEADSYRQAEEILEAIENGTYCCLVKDVALIRGNDRTEEGAGGEVIYGNLQVTYYEMVSEDEKSNHRKDGYDN